MELERRWQRREDPKEAAGAEDARSIHDVPDDLLRRFFLHLDSPIWLIRAACACKRWRRVVTDGADEGRTFLRLARSLHPPTVVGQYHNHNAEHRFVPSSSRPLPIDGSRFTVDDCLIKNFRWHVEDCHGGLVLLRMIIGRRCAPSVPISIVYDPLTRQHRSIYQPPTPPPNKQISGGEITSSFLVDGEDGNISISNFRVLYRWFKGGFCTGDPQLCVFSTAKGGNWSFLSHHDLFPRFSGDIAGRVDGSLYLGLFACRIIALDNTSLVFTEVHLPVQLADTAVGWPTFTVVHGAGLGPTSPPSTFIVHVCDEELELFRRVHGSSEWVMEHSIPNLSEATRDLSVCLEKKKYIKWRTMVDVIADDTSFAVLSAYSCGDDYRKSWFFSFDVNTMELRVLPEENYRSGTNSIFNYTLPWPQFLRAYP